MTSVTLRPTTTSSNDGAVTGAGGDADLALRDNDVATYIEFDLFTEAAEFGLDDVTLPSGARFIDAVVTLLGSVIGSGFASVNFILSAPGSLISKSGFLNLGAFQATYSSRFTFDSAPTDANLDALTLRIGVATPLSGTQTKWRANEAYVELSWVEQPTVNVTGPTGTVDDTTQPMIEWTADLDYVGAASAYPMTRYEVKVFDEDTYTEVGFDPDSLDFEPAVESHVQPGAALSWTSPAESLENLKTYRAYVRVAQFVNGADFWSDWDYSEFDVDVDTPNPPSLLVIGDSVHGRVNIEIQDSDTQTSTSTDTVELQRSDDGGATWKFIRLEQEDTHLEVTTGEPITLQDYEAPEGRIVYYRARGVHEYTGPVNAAGEWTTEPVSWDMGALALWLKAPLKPELNVQVTPVDMGSLDAEVSQGVFDVLDRADPVVVSGVRRTVSGTIVFEVINARRDEVRALLANPGKALVQARFEDDWEDRYVVFGKHVERRVIEKSDNRYTEFAVPWREVTAPPVSVSQGEAPPVVTPPPVTPPATPFFATGFPRWEKNGLPVTTASVGDTLTINFGPRNPPQANLQNVSQVNVAVYNFSDPVDVFRQNREGTTLDNIDTSYTVQTLDNNEPVRARGQLTTPGGILTFNETTHPQLEIDIADPAEAVPPVVESVLFFDATDTGVSTPITIPSKADMALLVAAFNVGDDNLLQCNLDGTMSPGFDGVEVTYLPDESRTTDADIGRAASFWGLVNPEVGAHTLNISGTAGSRVAIHVILLSGVDLANPWVLPDYTANDGGGAVTSLDVTVPGAVVGQKIISAAAIRSTGGAPTIGSGQNRDKDDLSGTNLRVVTTSKDAAAGTNHMTYGGWTSDYAAAVALLVNPSTGVVVPPGGGGGGGGGTTGDLSSLLAYDMGGPTASEAPTPMRVGYGQATGSRYSLGVNSFRSGGSDVITAWFTAFERANTQGTAGTNTSPAYVQVADVQCWVDDEVLGWVRVQYSQQPQLFVYYDAATTGTTGTSIPSGEHIASPATGGGRAIHIGAPNGVNGLTRAGSLDGVGYTWHSFPVSQTALYGSGAPAQASRMRAVIFACRARIVDRNGVAIGQPGCVTADITSARYIMQMGGDGRKTSPSNPPNGDVCIGIGRILTSEFKVYTASDMRQVLHAAQVNGISITGVASASEYVHA